MANELQTSGGGSLDHYSPKAVMDQTRLIHELMREGLVEGEHYGVIPGTKKNTLLQPGAQKICFMLRLVPSYEVTRHNLERGHIEYQVTCTLTHQATGSVVAVGIGSCSTLESKYRYRKYNGQRQENSDIADQYNTVLKMAKKRAYVDATLTATAAGDVFTQDMEDVLENERAAQGPAPKPQDNNPELTPAMAAIVEDIQGLTAQIKNQKIKEALGIASLYRQAVAGKDENPLELARLRLQVYLKTLARPEDIAQMDVDQLMAAMADQGAQ